MAHLFSDALPYSIEWRCSSHLPQLFFEQSDVAERPSRRIRRVLRRYAGIQLFFGFQCKVHIDLAIHIFIVILFPPPESEVGHGTPPISVASLGRWPERVASIWSARQPTASCLLQS